MGAQFPLPLQTVIPGQLIASSLWNNEFNNIATNLIPAGIDSYSDTDAQMQIQTNPYPGSVTSHATSLGGEIERIRYQINQIMGTTAWYQSPGSFVKSSGVTTPANLTDIVNLLVVPIGGIIDYVSSLAPPQFCLADGRGLSIAHHEALFALVGTTYGGDGISTFGIPDLRNRMTIGAGSTYNGGDTGGAATHTLTSGELPVTAVSITDPGHLHSISDPTHSHGVTDPTHVHVEQYKVTGTSGNGIGPTTNQGNGTPTSANAPNTLAASTGITINNASTGITSANANTTGITATLSGGGGAHSILNPYIGLYKMIRIL